MKCKELQGLRVPPLTCRAISCTGVRPPCRHHQDELGCTGTSWDEHQLWCEPGWAGSEQPQGGWREPRWRSCRHPVLVLAGTEPLFPWQQHQGDANPCWRDAAGGPSRAGGLARHPAGWEACSASPAPRRGQGRGGLTSPRAQELSKARERMGWVSG